MNMTVEVNNCNVVMTCLKQSVDGQRYIIRLFNNSSSDVKAELKVAQASLELSFSSYEVITAAYDGELSICAQMDIQKVNETVFFIAISVHQNKKTTATMLKNI